MAVYCYQCGCELTAADRCPNCGTDVARYKKIIYTSNYMYNDGLQKAQVRDLSGAILSLKQSLWYNKDNLPARNLLGLIYFEIGETVAALSEWVISKNINDTRLHEPSNLGEQYLGEVQSSRQVMDNLSTSIERYNYALELCYQRNLDVAALQLRKVLTINPHYLRARQLLSLLYITQQQWQRAAKELEKCRRLDVTNTTTLRYLKEVAEHIDITEGPKTGSKPAARPRRRIFSGVQTDPGVVKYKNEENETIIQPVGSHLPGVEGFRVPEWATGALIGAILGAAVIFFLVMPARIQNVRSRSAEDARLISSQVDVKDASIRTLEGQVETLEQENADLTQQLQTAMANQATDGGKSNNLFYTAACYINDPQDTQTSTSAFRSLKPDTAKLDVSDQFAALYDALYIRLQPAMLDKIAYAGIDAYEADNPDYSAVISLLEEANLYENPDNWSMTYVQRLYYLGDAYLQSYLSATEVQRAELSNHLSRARGYLNMIRTDFASSPYSELALDKLEQIDELQS